MGNSGIGLPLREGLALHLRCGGTGNERIQVAINHTIATTGRRGQPVEKLWTVAPECLLRVLAV